MLSLNTAPQPEQEYLDQEDISTEPEVELSDPIPTSDEFRARMEDNEQFVETMRTVVEWNREELGDKDMTAKIQQILGKCFHGCLYTSAIVYVCGLTAVAVGLTIEGLGEQTKKLNDQTGSVAPKQKQGGSSHGAMGWIDYSDPNAPCFITRSPIIYSDIKKLTHHWPKRWGRPPYYEINYKVRCSDSDHDL